jgi:hypothetical protein
MLIIALRLFWLHTCGLWKGVTMIDHSFPLNSFAKKYQHDLTALYTAYYEQRITEEELIRRCDELKAQEATANEPLGHQLLMQTLDDAEEDVKRAVQAEFQRKQKEAEDKVRTQAAEAERKRKVQEAEEERKRKAQEAEATRKWQKQQLEQREKEKKVLLQQKQREKERAHYRFGVTTYIGALEHSAQRWQYRYTWLQILLLCFSAVTATLAGIDGVPRSMVAVTGVVATITGGLLTTFKIQDRIYANRKAVVDVTLECRKYDHRIDEYASMKDDEDGEEQAFITFSRKITAIQGEQMLQEVELWNPKKGEPKEDRKTASPTLREQESQEEKGQKEQTQEEQGPEGQEEHGVLEPPSTADEH